MKRKLLSLALALAVALTLMPTAALAAEELKGDGTTYNVAGPDTTAQASLALTQTGGTAKELTVDIPFTVTPNADDGKATFAAKELVSVIAETTGAGTVPAGTPEWNGDICTLKFDMNGASSGKYGATVTVSLKDSLPGQFVSSSTNTSPNAAGLNDQTGPITITINEPQDNNYTASIEKKNLTIAIASATQVKDGDVGTRDINITWTATTTDGDAFTDATKAGVIKKATVKLGNDANAPTAELSDLGTITFSGKVLTFTDGKFEIPANADIAANASLPITLTATLDDSGDNGAAKFNAPGNATGSLNYTKPPAALALNSASYNDTAKVLTLSVSDTVYSNIKSVSILFTRTDVAADHQWEVLFNPNLIVRAGTDTYTFDLNGHLPKDAGTYSVSVEAHPSDTTQYMTGEVTAQGTCVVTAVPAPAPEPVTPTTPADEIPAPTDVNSSETASAAVESAQKMDTAEVAAQIEKELTDDTVTTTETLDKLEKLDEMVQNFGGIKVEVVPDNRAPAIFTSKNVKIVGAALNAEKPKEIKNLEIDLEISSAKTERRISGIYDRDNAVHFSMTLTNVARISRLKVPVVITLPLPSGMRSDKIRVLHYADADSSADVIIPKVSKNEITFVVTGFSDFVITEEVGRGGSSGRGSSGVTVNTPVTVAPITVTPTKPAGIFTDVPAGHTFASQISWARDNSIMGGYADGSFKPTATTNRQQMWMVLARLAGAAPADMAAAREWAVNAGISDGTNPQGAMSRQQLITMLYRFAQSQNKAGGTPADLGTYADAAAVASYAEEALAWGVGSGIITGTSDGKLNPEGSATRAHFAAFLYRYSHMA